MLQHLQKMARDPNGPEAFIKEHPFAAAQPGRLALIALTISLTGTREPLALEDREQINVNVLSDRLVGMVPWSWDRAVSAFRLRSTSWLGDYLARIRRSSAQTVATSAGWSARTERKDEGDIDQRFHALARKPTNW